MGGIIKLTPSSPEELEAVRTTDRTTVRTIDRTSVVRTTEDDLVRTSTVRTRNPDLVRTSTVRTIDRTTVRTGRYDSLHDDYPERIEIRAKLGTKAWLKWQAEKRGMSLTKLMTASVEEYIKNHSATEDEE